jgi:hypothetical protein
MSAMLSGRWLHRQQKQWLPSAGLADLFVISAVVTLDSSANLNSPIVGAPKLPDALFGMATVTHVLTSFVLRVGLEEVETSH